MEKIQAILTMLGIPLSILFGAWHPFLTVLFVLTALDILTGLAKGLYRRELRSRRMSEGMIRKSMIFVVLIVANMIDIVLFGGIPIAKMSCILFYIAQEGLSVLENLGQMDVKLPRFIREHLLVLREKNESLDPMKHIGKK